MTCNAILIHHFLENSADRFPDKVAVVHDEKRLTYSQINQAANHLAVHLISSGVKKGCLIPMIFENSPDYIIAYYGILKAGAVAVPLGTDLKPEKFSYYIKELEADTIIASDRFKKLIKAADPKLHGLSHLILCKTLYPLEDTSLTISDFTSIVFSDAPCSSPDLEIDSESLANIIYTSGSTGSPKGVMLSHRNIVENTHSICEYLKLNEKDIQMVVLPFFYVMGQSLMNTHFSVGGTLVINNTFAYPATVVQQMIDEKVTGFSGVPSTYSYLLHKSPLKDRREELIHLRYCSQAGGHMASHVKLSLKKALPNHTDIFIMYGATEASARLAYLGPEELTRKTDSIGKAIPNVELYVADNNGKPVTDGEVGELIGRGPNIMLGYFKDPDLTAKKIGLEGYHTGDLCYRDRDGFFFLVGRKDDLIKVGGHRINPLEIEDALMGSDLILEVAVVGVPDDFLGNRLAAFVVPKNETIKENDIMIHCHNELPRFKNPSLIIFTQFLPKKASGKIDKFKCLDMIIQKIQG